MIAIQNELFPNGGLQERSANFSEFYIEYGNALIEKLMLQLQPFENKFTIVTL
jgi:uncharacterized protein YllA (UPF0747 family)